MAAPTVGAVMADILPYLGVSQNFSEEDAAGKQVILEDYQGMTAAQAQKQLKTLGLTAQCIGSGETVTGQLPAAGQSVSGDSQILLYFGEDPKLQQVEMPDFSGMNRQQANDAAGKLSLYILPKGNLEIAPGVTVASQSIARGTKVSAGTTVTLQFVDTGTSD